MIYELSKMLRLNPEHAEASMYSESAARAALSRRGLLAAGAALAVGTAFSFGHSAMSPREFHDLLRATLPDYQISVGPGRDIYSDEIDPKLIGAALISPLGKESRLAVDPSLCDSPFARSRLKAAIGRHAGVNAACLG